MWVRGVAATAVLLAGLCGSASAEVLVQIDKSAQRMTVTVDGAPAHVWPVSTGKSGFGTPNGRFRPQRLARTWFSRKYYNSPMPYSIFFHGGYAIHGTNYIRRLGGPASHGCVRLHPGNAATLFALVQRHGSANTRIVVTGGRATMTAKRKAPRPQRASAANDGYEAAPVSRARVYGEPAYRYPSFQPRYYGAPADDDFYN